jgi:hypothetical protein
MEGRGRRTEVNANGMRMTKMRSERVREREKGKECKGERVKDGERERQREGNGMGWYGMAWYEDEIQKGKEEASRCSLSRGMDSFILWTIFDGNK